MKNVQNNQLIDLNLHYQRKTKEKILNLHYKRTTKEKFYNFRTQPVNNHSLENLIEMLATDTFRHDNYERLCNKLSTEERKSLQEMRSLSDHIV